MALAWNMCCIFQQLNLASSGIKTFSAIPISSTEMSEITPVAILDEAADKQDTVMKVFNKLYEKFKIGVKSKFVNAGHSVLLIPVVLYNIHFAKRKV